MIRLKNKGSLIKVFEMKMKGCCLNLRPLLINIHYNEIQDSIHAKRMDRGKELWRGDNLSDEDRQKYMKHIEDLRYGVSTAWTMKIDAENKIKERTIGTDWRSVIVQFTHTLLDYNTFRLFGRQAFSSALYHENKLDGFIIQYGMNLLKR